MADNQRRLYQAAYRTEIDEDNKTTQNDEPGNQDADPSNTSTTGPETPEDRTWKKRYGDLRSHANSLTEQVKSLQTQVNALQKKEVQIPSTKEELDAFASKYPDVYRHIRSIAMAELLQERENISNEKKQTEEDLDRIKRELGYRKIISKHPDFEELNLSEKFHEWAQLQPKQIQDWLFEETDPDLCIKALDLYKAEVGFKAKPQPRRGADTAVNTRSNANLSDEGGKRVWKASEIGKLHPKEYERLEAEIEAARREGRLDLTA